MAFFPSSPTFNSIFHTTLSDDIFGFPADPADVDLSLVTPPSQPPSEESFEGIIYYDSVETLTLPPVVNPPLSSYCPYVNVKVERIKPPARKRVTSEYVNQDAFTNQRPLEFSFSNQSEKSSNLYNFIFQFIDPKAYVSCDFCCKNLTSSGRNNKIYVCDNPSEQKIVKGHILCLNTNKIISKEKIRFLRNLFSALCSRSVPAIWIRQLWKADMLEADYRMTKEKGELVLKDIIHEGAYSSLSKIIKNTKTLASPQLILFAYQNSVLKYCDALLYLKRIYKVNDLAIVAKLESFNNNIINRISTNSLLVEENLRPFKIKKRSPKNPLKNSSTC